MSDNTSAAAGAGVIERLRSDWELSRSHFVRSPRMTADEVKEARDAHERLTRYYNWLPAILALESSRPPVAGSGEAQAIRDFLLACSAEANRQRLNMESAGHRLIARDCAAESKAYSNAAKMIEREDHASYRLATPEPPALEALRPTAEDVQEAAQFLSDRLDDLEWHDGQLDDTLRNYMGHVDPAHARLKAALSTERGSRE